MITLDKPVSATGPMLRSDVPAVAQLFMTAFRDGQAPSAAFCTYFERSFFSTPLYDEAIGSLVHRDGEGRVDSALLVLPMQVSIHGRVLPGRLMSNYMTDPASRTRGGADMVLTIRARKQEFCFSDSANPVSAAHWQAIGGHRLPIQSLDWRVVLRPAGWLVGRGARRLPRWAVPFAKTLARPFDALVQRLLRREAPIASTGSAMPREVFVAAAPKLVERFALHPVWSAAELNWVLDMAALNTADGPLTLRQVHDAKGELVGCSVGYAKPGGVAKVLNILSVAGGEAAVLADLIACADALGCTAIQGMAQPFLMAALGQVKGMGFAPRGAYCISTRHPEIVAAVQAGDAYLGGLFGEDWSRLLSDFQD